MTFSSEVHSRESSFQDPWSVVGRTVTYRSWENVAHAEKLWKEAESKKPGLRARMTGDQRGLGQFASQEGTKLAGKQAASKSIPVRCQRANRRSPFLVPVLLALCCHLELFPP